jgi:hypothetical protein
MMKHAVTGSAPVPMSEGKRAWGVHDIFDSSDGRKIFIGVVTERQREIFTRDLGISPAAAPVSDWGFAMNRRSFCIAAGPLALGAAASSSPLHAAAHSCSMRPAWSRAS